MKKILMLLLSLLAASGLSAQTTSFTYQGRLNDGNNPANGTYDFQFALSDAASGGNQIGGILTNSATLVSNGLFTVTLDFGPSALPGADRWLEISVAPSQGGAFATLSPRQQLTATPYAIQAVNAATANSVAAANLTGSLSPAQLPANLLTNGQPGVTLSGTLAGDGSGLTSLSAGSISAGTLPDARLSGNVALLNADNNFTGVNSLSDMDLRLRPSPDPNHGLGWYGGVKWFGGVPAPDGPVLYGYGGGALGTTSGGQRVALQWDSAGNVTIPSLHASGNGAGLTDINLNLNSGGAIIAPTGFTVNSTLRVGTSPQCVVAADVNGDGKMDLICANEFDNTLSVLTNNGNGGFVLASSPSVGRYPFKVIATDLNGDGKVDLVSVNLGDNTLSVLINNGIGNFALASSPSVGLEPFCVAAADVNGDGKVDLITANIADNTLTVLTNNGSGGFVLASTLPGGNGPSYVLAADVNGDGKVDLISANDYSSTLSVLTNNGSGGFVLASSPAVGQGPESLAAADINGDGKLDLISGNYGANTLSVLTNDGTGGFAVASVLSVGRNPLSVLAADVNGDGKVDLICANSFENTLSVMINNGSGGFASASPPVVGNGPTSVAAADVNGDGRLDLICANSQDYTLSVLTYPSATFRGGFSGSGAGLTNLSAASIASGTIADTRLSANVALLGGSQAFVGSNSFTGVTALTNASNILAGNGAALTSINAGNIGSGTLADARLSANVALLNASQTFSGSNTFTGVALITNANNVLAGIHAGNGSGLTSLNAANLTGAVPSAALTSVPSASLSGTIADPQLSFNVALRSGGNLFSQAQRVISTSTNGTESLDQQQTSESNSGGDLDPWQSFTAGTAGLLTRLELKIASPLGPSPSPGTLRIYSGEGTGGTLLDTESVSIASGLASFQSFSLSQPLLLQAGSNYTYRLTVAQIAVGWVPQNTSNPYPGGRSGYGAGTDLLFKTYMKAIVTNDVLAVNTSPSASVGIGTNAPQAKLHVIGDVLASGMFTGNASGLTNVQPASISGVFAPAQIPNLDASKITTGTFTGNGSGLTALNASNLASGALNDARLSANVALLNANQSFSGSNWFTGVALLTNANNTLTGVHAGNGAALTALNASNLIGIVADTRLSANVAMLNGSQGFTGSNTFSGVAVLANTNNTLTGTHSGNGAALIALNAGNVATGTLADVRLSTNVVLRSGINDFTGTNALDNHDLRLRGSSDANHGLGWYGPSKTFDGVELDGPALYGYSAGALGTTINFQRIALLWTSAGNVQVAGNLLASSFTGDGSGLTNLNLSQITSPFVTNGEANLTLSGTFSGDGSALTGVAVNNLNGAMPLDNSLTITGNRNGDFNNSLVLMQNNNTGPSAAPALRVVNGHPAGRSPEGALSVSANVVSSASDSIIARFGNYSAWVLTITNDGSIYSAGDVYARGVKLTSDRNAKDKFTTVDSQTILEKVAALPMSEWDYKDDPGVRHLGPVAQDFHAAFGLNGSDDTHISVVDEGGVALAAIQGLNQKLEQKEAEITELKQRMELLESLLNRKLNGGAK